MQRLIDAHFAGAIGPAGERALRQHLPGCVGCRQRYERHLALEALVPAPLGPRERLARGLGLPRRQWAWGAALAVAGACAGLVLFAPGRGFAPRGGPPAPGAPELRIFRATGGDRPTAVAGLIGRADELAFAFRNPGGFTHLAVLGVDEHGHVYWYHPEWSDERHDPTTVAIAAHAALTELPAAVIHPLDGQRLEIVGIFARRPLRVREVEAALAAGRRLPDVHEVRVPVEVR